MALTHEQKEFLKSFNKAPLIGAEPERLEHRDLPKATRAQSVARQQCRLDGLAIFKNRLWQITKAGQDSLVQDSS